MSNYPTRLTIEDVKRLESALYTSEADADETIDRLKDGQTTYVQYSTAYSVARGGWQITKTWPVRTPTA